MRSIQFFAVPSEFARIVLEIGERLDLTPNVLDGAEVILQRDRVNILACIAGGADSSNLYESVIGVVPNELEAALTTAEWRTVRAVVRNQCSTGLWIVNPAEGVREFYRSWMYTRGAANAFSNGICLRQFKGSETFAQIDEPAANRYKHTSGRVIDRSFD